MDSKHYLLSIDYGTTNTTASIYTKRYIGDEGDKVVLDTDQGLPSIVAIPKKGDGDWLVGKDALGKRAYNRDRDA